MSRGGEGHTQQVVWDITIHMRAPDVESYKCVILNSLLMNIMTIADNLTMRIL